VQLDQSRIAICERSWAENLDLALQVMRAYGLPLALCAVAMIVPLAVLNHLFITSIFPDLWAEDATSGIYYWLTCLVLIEAPLATAPITLYLGQALFVEKPTARQVVRAFAACLPQLVLLQIVVRTFLILPIVTWIIPFALWPYLSEVIVLERNPLVSRDGRISTMKRNSLLHRGNSGDYTVRAISSGLLCMLLIAALYLTEDLLVRNLLGFEPGPTGWLVETQLAFWLVAVYFAVVRFLSYLDGRIRHEGWEVELLLRAQRARFARQAV
jgi:hypothetical protein